MIEEDGEIQIAQEAPPATTLPAAASSPSVSETVLRQFQSGNGVYIPPAKRKQLEAAAAAAAASQPPKQGPTPLQEQREAWQTQKRVIHGTINRLNASTIKPLIGDLFQTVNLIRLRGVLCKSVLQAAVSSPKFTNVYAALMSVINSKLPEVGELCTNRAILAFRRHYKNREKASCQAVTLFLAHLFHQGVVHELIILQLLSVLLDGDPTDDSVEVAVQLLQVTGQALLDVSTAGVRGCLERVRALLHEGNLNKRVEYKLEQLLKARKNGFREFPPLEDDLDLVERDDQITHDMTLDDESIQKEDHLDVFAPDENYDENEKEWSAIRAEILGEGDSSDDDDDDSSEGSSDDSDSDDESAEEPIPDQELPPATANKAVAVIQDLTEEDLINLRRTIYLTIMSSAAFEECVHKLSKIDIPQGREEELINMLIECCSQERTFSLYYGLVSARFCLLDDRWRDAFMKSFAEQYATIHRLETNKLRNVAKLFAHLLHSDAMPWSVFEIIHLNEDETTSSSRIFIKIVMQEMAEAIGIARLKKRFETTDPETMVWYAGMFPKDNVRNTRYAINFFTSIGLGPLTDDLRVFLKNAPKLILQKAKEAALAKKANDSDSSSVISSSSGSSSSSSSYTSSSSSSYSSSSSSSYSRRRGRRRGRSYSSGSSRSYSSSSRSSYSSSRSSSRRGRGRSRRRRRDSRSRSRSSSPPKEIIPDPNSRSPSRSPSPDGKKKKGRSSRSMSPAGRKQSNGRKRRDRSYSSSRSRSASRSRSPSRKERQSRSAKKRDRSRSRSPPPKKSKGEDGPSSRSPSRSPSPASQGRRGKRQRRYSSSRSR